MSIMKSDIQAAGGCLQTCTGIRSGIEATIHAATEIWQDEATEGLLQVDAENAFNQLNRKMALHNFKQVCPALQLFLQNHYQKPAKLIFSDESKQDHLLSEEGCTQGDPTAMAFYAGGTKPLIDILSDSVNKELCKQEWYADDSSAAGKLREIRKWWDVLVSYGPKFGYFPKASKTVLIIKDSSMASIAAELFADTGIQITCQGERHLGAAIGNEEFKNKYVSSKVKKWVEDIEMLADIAAEEPQAALSAYTKSICHRWTYIQRTISGCGMLFKPLENCIRNTLIPAILGRPVSDLERCILSLPVRFGGLGISDPAENADREYAASKRITKNLSDLIIEQQQDISFYNQESTAQIIKDLKGEKEAYLNAKFQDIERSIEDLALKRCLQMNKEKGAGCWLTTTATTKNF